MGECSLPGSSHSQIGDASVFLGCNSLTHRLNSNVLCHSIQTRRSSETILLNARNLVRHAGDRRLLDGVSLDLNEGDRIGLIGATGSGKSVLLRTLARLEPLDSGNLHWNGSPVSPQEASFYRSQVIYLHQQPFRFEGTVEDVLSAPFRLKVHAAKSFDRDWAIGQLQRIGRNESFLRQRHEQLSGGESQLVAILRALQLDPRVLLLDEPTSALDAHSTEAVEEVLLAWHAESPHSRAWIWVSHDRHQVERTCNRIFQMKSGRLQNDGAPD